MVVCNEKSSFGDILVRNFYIYVVRVDSSECRAKWISVRLINYYILLQVRHPNILSFLHSTEVETHDGSTSKVTIYIVTEPVMPLSDKIKELGLKATQRYELFSCYEH